MTTAIVLFRAEYGGWIVKRHRPIDCDTRILFAGNRKECVEFIEGWATGLETEHE
jgi:hypothetical protein